MLLEKFFLILGSLFSGQRPRLEPYRKKVESEIIGSITRGDGVMGLFYLKPAAAQFYPYNPRGIKAFFFSLL